MFGSDVIQRDAVRREARLVNLVVDAMGLEDQLGEVYRSHERTTGEHARLTFSAFRTAFPDFPYVLRYENLYRLNRLSQFKPRDMIRNPKKSLVAARFRDVVRDLEQEANGRPIAMLFPYDRLKGGLVLNNDEPRAIQVGDSAKLHWTENGESRCLQMLLPLLSSLRRTPWEADRVGSAIPPEYEYAPILMRQIKDDSAYRLLLFLLCAFKDAKFFEEGPLPNELELERYDGGMWIRITRTKLAQSTGMLPDRVKRALRFLREEGLIEIGKTGRSNLYRFTNKLYLMLEPGE